MPLTVQPSLFVSKSSGAENLARWQAFTRHGLQAEATGNLDLALTSHVHALRIARELLESPLLRQCTDDCLAAAVCSHHNLADVHQQRGQLWQAARHLCWAHCCLLRVARDSGEPPAVRHATHYHLDMTRYELLAWTHEHGPQPDVEAVLALALPSEPLAPTLH